MSWNHWKNREKSLDNKDTSSELAPGMELFLASFLDAYASWPVFTLPYWERISPQIFLDFAVKNIVYEHLRSKQIRNYMF